MTMREVRGAAVESNYFGKSAGCVRPRNMLRSTAGDDRFPFFDTHLHNGGPHIVYKVQGFIRVRLFKNRS